MTRVNRAVDRNCDDICAAQVVCGHGKYQTSKLTWLRDLEMLDYTWPVLLCWVLAENTHSRLHCQRNASRRRSLWKWGKSKWKPGAKRKIKEWMRDWVKRMNRKGYMWYTRWERALRRTFARLRRPAAFGRIFYHVSLPGSLAPKNGDALLLTLFLQYWHVYTCM